MKFLYAILAFCLVGVYLNANSTYLEQTKQIGYEKKGVTFVIPEPFIVNLMGQNGRRYVKASIALELSSPELQKEVTTKLLLIKDTIIRVMSSKTFEEISTPKGRDKLKEEILQEINSYMVDGYIKSVLFSEFILQTQEEIEDGRADTFFVIPEPFIVNLTGSKGRTYLKTSITLELYQSKFYEEVRTKLPLIKDVIINILSSKTFEEVSTSRGKKKLKDEMLKKINSRIKNKAIKAILFSEFVIQ